MLRVPAFKYEQTDEAKSRPSRASGRRARSRKCPRLSNPRQDDPNDSEPQQFIQAVARKSLMKLVSPRSAHERNWPAGRMRLVFAQLLLFELG